MKRLVEAKLFLDGGDPSETARANALLAEAGFGPLDGQTTNPSLVAKNPEIAAQIERGERLSESELLERYKEIVQGIERQAPGYISVEVYADADTKVEEMVAQAREFGGWITSAVIKLPVTGEGLKAAEILKGELPLNMTLCFSQAQAASVYAATKGAKHPVFVSPFVGRLDDQGLDGVQHIRNVLQMYGDDSHVQVLAASFRRIESFLEVLRLGTDAVTVNFGLFELWAQAGFSLEVEYSSEGADIPYEELDLSADWRSFDLGHELTEVGLQRFADDWNGLLK